MSTDKLALNVHFNEGKGSLVLLIHGVEASGQFWLPIDTELARERHVISIDLLGFGDSPKSPSGRYTLVENVDALEEALANIDLGQKMTVVGHSMGTFVALEFARRHPDRVEKIVLTSPVFVFKKGPLSYKRPNEFIQNFFLQLASIPRKLIQILADSVNTTYRAIFKRGVHLIPSIMSIDSIIDRQDPLPLLSDLQKIPIKILFGYFDNLVINSNIYYLAERFPNIQLQRFPRFHDIPHKEQAALIKTILSK